MALLPADARAHAPRFGKRLFAAALCAAAVSVCAACAAGPAQGPAGGSPEASADGGAGHTVVVAIGAGFSTLDPGREYEKYPPLILNACYETLFKFYSNEDKPQPLLAESYAFSDDALTLRVTLREANFASGNPVTSEDVRFSVERCRNLRGNSAFICDTIGEIETPDERTVVFHLTRADSAILSKLTYSSLAVLDSAVVKEHGGTDDFYAEISDRAESFLNTASAGSGMYVMTAYTPDREIVLEKNPNYWGESTNVDKYIIKIEPDPAAQAKELFDKEIDIAMNLTAESMISLAKVSDIRLINSPTKTVSFVMMNMDPYIGGPVADEHVQQAIRLALDYAGVREIVGEGCITPYSVIQNGFLGSRGERPADYTDLDAARAELALSPYPDGFSVELTVCDLDMEGTVLADLAEKVKADLSQIGIDVKIVNQAWAEGYGDAYRNGEIGFTVMYWSPDYNDPNVQLEFLPGMTVGLRAGWTVAMGMELHDKCDEAVEAIDEGERARILGEIQDGMYENGPFLFIAQAPAHIGCDADLSGVAFSDPYALDLTCVNVA